MKKFIAVFQFELMNYLKNKTFIISTVMIMAVLLAGLFLPRFIDLSESLGTKSISGQSNEKTKEKEEEKEITKYGIVDKNGYIADKKVLESAFEDSEFTTYDDVEKLKKAVKSEKIDAGFEVQDDLNYQYYVVNKDVMNMDNEIFSSVMSTIHKQIYCEQNQLDYASISQGYEAEVNVKEHVLGKNAEDNYWYCYMLVIVIFMLIIFYGTMIATAVTTEKSNRSIEVLVTSVNSTYLLFGKVLAGTLAALLQSGAILASALLGYQANKDIWKGKLDMLFSIPTDVLLAFIFFGLGGFLFFAFIYGALGALVSKTEDINKVAGNVQMIIMIVYFIVLFQLQNVDSLVIKICSYLPFSSYSAMFARIAMGEVAPWEIVVSFAILVVSIILVGWIAAKIYRMGTLRYGNPIKFSNALKSIRKERQ